ncbi:dienelactone hydrolase family protein [Occallatibacter savannae]|uniref:dienelactone hydrolase family protein n=1 Tax=Occallatibacter savannae TaxID=1002691 RepID=UPI000D685D7C|nr:dienelactone hydrolase family protein [Occallatibacter savannae]
MKLCQTFVAAALMVPTVSVLAATPQTAHFTSGERQIAYDVYGSQSSGPLIIMLHGVGGPDAPLYRQLADDLSTKNNYTVLFLHYFDATDTFRASPQNHAAWEKVVADLVDECRRSPQWSNRKIGILGFSLGASVALAAGSQMLPVSAVAEWYGSLPDAFFYQIKGMPPLLILHGQHDDNIPVSNAQQLVQLCRMKNFTCESHIYPNQGHGFLPPDFDDAVKRTLDFFSRNLK